MVAHVKRPRSAAPPLQSRARLVPVMFAIPFLALSVALFAFGPWPYKIRNPELTYGFLGAANLAWLLGYVGGVRGTPGFYGGSYSAERLTAWSIGVSVVLIIPTIWFRAGTLALDLVASIENPGEAYLRSRAARSRSIPFVEHVRLLFGPVLVMMLPLSTYYWRRIGTLARFGAVGVIAGTCALYVAIGTNKALADTLVLLPFVLLGGHISRVHRLSFGRRTLVILAAITGALAFLLFFGQTQSTRLGSSASVGYFPAIGAGADYTHVLLRDRSTEWQIAVLGVSSYLTQGYYALSLSLGEPWVPTFGMGHSLFLIHQVADVLGDWVLALPYPMRIEKYGWNGHRLWSSIYPWIASDVSFPGTIVVMYFVGRFWGQSWLDTLGGRNPLGVVMFAQFTIMVFYIPANNQVLQSPEGFFAFWITLVWWRLTRYR